MKNSSATSGFAAVLLGLLLAAVPVPALAAQEADPAPDRALSAAPDLMPATAVGEEFQLTVPEIMRGPELVGEPPEQVRWTDDGGWIYFRWKPGGEDWHEDPALYRVRIDDEPERLSDAEADSLGVLVADGDLSPDETKRVVSHLNDLFLVDTRTLDFRRLTDTRARETSPVFGPEGRTVYFVRAEGEISNVFSLSLEDGTVRQLSDLRPGPEPPEDEEPEGHREFLEEQQRELFEHIRIQEEKREEREAREEAREERKPETVYLKEKERVVELAVSPSGLDAVLRAGTEAEDARPTLVPDYVTADGYVDQLEGRPKVGDVQADARVGLMDLETGEVDWLELVPDDGEDDETAEADPETRAPDDPDLAASSFLGWNEDGSAGLVSAVSFDHRDQWLYALDPETGELTLLAHHRDEAWVGGPCAPWLSESCAGWLPDGERVFYLAEEDGWSHLYVVPRGGGDATRLTGGEWEVHAVDVLEGAAAEGGAEDAGRAAEPGFLLTASRESPFERHLYRLDFEGGEPERLTTRTGSHDAVVSPDERSLAVVHSASNRPPELYVMENRPGAEMRRHTASPTDAWEGFPWIDPEIVHFEARDGTRVPARIYRPADLDAEPNGAGVIFVHGAGYLQNVHRWWSVYYREYMFHHLLASLGYTVLDIDYRGSAGYGSDWRTAIYRHMGGWDLTDQVDGATYLAEHEGVDPERIGIYGGSYGGFITLMALFLHPETFSAGAALRSVTDWAHYNHWYTGRILNLPHEDEEAYRRSSPIYHAEGLEDPLLILHGMVDTNVQFQDVVRLSQRLIELGKEDWELAVYPVEGHGFEEPPSWTDEYRRILDLFEEHLR